MTPPTAPATHRQRLRGLLPARADYRELRKTWRGDLVAGVTVGIVALPLALGFGVSSGVSAQAGLVTAIVAGMIAAFFGGSHVQVSGPTGAMVVVLLPIAATHGIAAVAVVSVMAGAVVLAAGVLRLGRAVGFIPWPVIEGFTLGIAVIIFVQQIPLLTTAAPVAAGKLSTNAVVAAGQAIAGAQWTYLPWSVGAAALVAAAMLLAPRIHPAIPGSLVGIVAVTVLCVLLPIPLAVIGVLPDALPPLSIPVVPSGELPGLIGPALTVAALAAIESLLSARVAASLDATGPYDPDRELFGQGLASIGSGLFGGMPATGAIARTAVNIRAGGRTRLASLTHAIVLLLVVLVLSVPVGHIPLAALAGVLMVTAWRMLHLATVTSILRSTRSDAAAFIVTAVITVSFDLVIAVAIGVAFAGFFAIRTLARGTHVRREQLHGVPAEGDQRIAVIRVDGPLIFASADRVFEEATAVHGVSVVILRLSSLDHVDATGARMLSDITQALERRGVTVLIKGIRPGHEKLLRTVGVVSALRHQNHLFLDLDDAIVHARSHVEREQQPHPRRQSA